MTAGVLVLLVLWTCGCSLVSSTYRFPSDFKFGVATSAYQIEGAWNQDGKGLNIFDVLLHASPGLVADGSNGDIACDSYHKYAEDVQWISYLGAKYYRLSISWTRILPGGLANNVNPAGVAYYNNVINELLANGIQPAVTIYHWDTPYNFNPFGGFTNEALVDFYGDYARLLFQLFGDRVKLWFTINEPKIICAEFHKLLGSLVQPYPNGVIEYQCGKVILLAHARAYHIYDKEFRRTQKGKITIVLNFDWPEPLTNSPEDRKAAEIRRQFEFGWFANPIFKGGYPSVLINRVTARSHLEGFPRSRSDNFKLSLAEQLYIYGTADFLALNHYNTNLVQAYEYPVTSPSVPGYEQDIGGISRPSLQVNPDLTIGPRGFRSLLNWIKRNYRNPEIYITENGFVDGGGLNDPGRIAYIKAYLNSTLYAINEDKVKVRAYFHWSLLDNFEWFSGYTVKLGLIQVDFNDPDRTRTPKLSADYYKTRFQLGFRDGASGRSEQGYTCDPFEKQVRQPEDIPLPFDCIPAP